LENIVKKFGADHSRCDQIFAETEELISDENWVQGGARFLDFNNAMLHHFDVEETVLFPRVEEGNAMAGGPVQMMRSEHEQMRDLLRIMSDAVERQDQDDYLGYAETLLIIMQQHNTKEEQILYPMADQTLSAEIEDILQCLDAVSV